MVNNELVSFENWSPHLKMVNNELVSFENWSPHLKMVNNELVSFENWSPHLKMVNNERASGHHTSGWSATNLSFENCTVRSDPGLQHGHRKYLPLFVTPTQSTDWQ